MIQSLSEHFSPAVPQGESCSFESFHAVPEISEFLLSVVLELHELRSVGGKGGSGLEPKAETGQRPEHYETSKHTAVCGQPPTVLADPPQQPTNPS